MGTVPDILRRHGAERAQETFATIVRKGHPDAVISYADLCGAGRRVAGLCRTHGVAPDEIVLVILPTSPELLQALFGAIYAGRPPSVLAPPSFKLDKDAYAHELEALINRISASLLVTTKKLLDQLGEVLSRCDSLRSMATWDDVASAPEEEPPELPQPGAIALLQHSSGSTGLKKGVALSHQAILAQVEAYREALGLSPEDVIVSWLPLYHDMGLIACTIVPLVTATPIVMLDPLEWVVAPASLLEAITRFRGTLCWQPNFAYSFLAKRVGDDELAGVELGSLRGLVNCSEPVMADSHRQFIGRFEGLGVRPSALWTSYAMAEFTFAVTQSSPGTEPVIDRVRRDAFLEENRAVPAGAGEPHLEIMSSGRPIRGAEVRVVDQAGKSLPDRHVGEIAVRGPCLFAGYFALQEVTGEVLRDGWYYTGDLGYRVGDELFVTGRLKDLIIVGGRNYYPQDIERIVSDDPDVHDGRTVALGVPDPALGTERLVVLAETTLADPDALRQAKRRIRQAVTHRLDCTVSDIRLVPHMWLLKTSSGKIARQPNLTRYLEHFGQEGERD